MVHTAATDSQLWQIFCDGSAVPNPGYMALGAVITAPDCTQHTLSRATHTRGCNNEAELLALMAALQNAQSRGAQALRIFTDNSILVEQLSTQNAKPIERLAGLFDDARALLGAFGEVSLKWIPRHRNGEADTLARAALGLLPKSAMKPSNKKKRA